MMGILFSNTFVYTGGQDATISILLSNLYRTCSCRVYQGIWRKYIHLTFESFLTSLQSPSLPCLTQEQGPIVYILLSKTSPQWLFVYPVSQRTGRNDLFYLWILPYSVYSYRVYPRTRCHNIHFTFTPFPTESILTLFDHEEDAKLSIPEPIVTVFTHVHV